MKTMFNRTNNSSMSTFVLNKIYTYTYTREHNYLRRRLVFMDNNIKALTNDKWPLKIRREIKMNVTLVVLLYAIDYQTEPNGIMQSIFSSLLQLNRWLQKGKARHINHMYNTFSFIKYHFKFNRRRKKINLCIYANIVQWHK